MNLRLPLVLTIVAVAGGAAAMRAFHSPAAVPAVTFSQDMPQTASRPPLRKRAETQVVVYVAGAVAHRGVYRLTASSRAVDALHAAGGATSSADLVAVNLAAPLTDGDEVVVPEKGAADDAAASNDTAASNDGTTTRKHHKRKKHRKKGRKKHHHRAARAIDASNDAVAVRDADGSSQEATSDAGPTSAVDVNTADANELETLPGLGSKLAERIVTFRELNGPFNAPDDLLDVGGMTQKRLDAIEPFLVSH